MVSDAVHSLSDVFATGIAFLGTLLSRQPADKEHPYGHERIECVASLILGLILLGTGAEIGKAGLKTIFSGDAAGLAAPGVIALAAAVVSILVKEGMFWYTRHYAKLMNSSVFMADAWHHRSDALSSIGSLIGIGGAMLGFPIMDPIASVIICLFILKVALEILKDAVTNMLDTSCGADFDRMIRDHVAAQDGVISVDSVQSRLFGSRVYVDLEISVNKDITVGEGHEIAEHVHDSLEQTFNEVKHVMVHVNPSESTEDGSH